MKTRKRKTREANRLSPSTKSKSAQSSFSNRLEYFTEEFEKAIVSYSKIFVTSIVSISLILLLIMELYLFFKHLLENR